jgi:hypothetical protein
MTTAPRIICRAGPSLDALSPVDVNRTPIHIDGPHFEGDVAVRLKDYRGPKSQEGNYARQPEQAFMGEGDTWSISFQGRWKDEVNADEVVSRAPRDRLHDHLCEACATMGCRCCVRGLRSLRD